MAAHYRGGFAMKRLPLFTLALLMSASAACEDLLPLVLSSDLPITDTTLPNYADDRDYPNFAGRLYIEDVSIDVALYLSNDQEVVDRKDSAAYFDLSSARGCMIIADHNTHAFSSLDNVKVGTLAQLVQDDGDVIVYQCVDIFKGHNTGKGITDWNGRSVIGDAELMMYTCFDGWQNVWIVLWDRVLTEAPTQAPNILQHFGTLMDQTFHTLLQSKPAEDLSGPSTAEIELVLQRAPAGS